MVKSCGSSHGVSEETMKSCLDAGVYIQLGARASKVKFWFKFYIIF